jgi:hypothetical protein
MKNKKAFVILLSVISLTSVFGIGFSTWSVTNKTSEKTGGSINADGVRIGNDPSLSGVANPTSFSGFSYYINESSKKLLQTLSLSATLNVNVSKFNSYVTTNSLQNLDFSLGFDSGATGFNTVFSLADSYITVKSDSNYTNINLASKEKSLTYVNPLNTFSSSFYLNSSTNDDLLSLLTSYQSYISSTSLDISICYTFTRTGSADNEDSLITNLISDAKCFYYTVSFN